MENLNNLPINLFDVGVIVILVISGFFAYARGFVHEVLSVAGWVGAILATFYLFPYAKPYARQVISIELAADLTAGVVIFVIALAALSMLTRGISRRVRDSAIGPLDRALGFLFGLLRGALIVVVLYIAALSVMPDKKKHPKWVTEARSMELIQPGADVLISHIPDLQRRSLTGSPKTPSAGAGTNTKDDSGSMVKDFVSPAPKGEKIKPDGGYDTKERQGIESLIGAGQQQ